MFEYLYQTTAGKGQLGNLRWHCLYYTGSYIAHPAYLLLSSMNLVALSVTEITQHKVRTKSH